MKIPKDRLDTIVNAYLECALWATGGTYEDGRDFDSYDSEGFEIESFTKAARAEARRDCRDFYEANRADLEASGLSDEQIGHNFWLTREGHGTGFWDRGLGEVGERLADAARAYGEAFFYIHRKRLHFS